MRTRLAKRGAKILVSDYVVKMSGNPSLTRIYTDEQELAEIRTSENLTYHLIAKNGNEWILNARVHGEIRPFSMTATISKAEDARDLTPGSSVLTIRDHLFLHNGKFYTLAGAPEGRPPREFLLGKRYICRLDNFPFSDLGEIDHETRSKLRRFRGPAVGELEGLGKEGHRVHLSDELEEISLPLAASCYLLYSTA
jgi:hypothetical protein